MLATFPAWRDANIAGRSSPRGAAGGRFCCRGCEYVPDLIPEQGFDRFYDLKQGLVVPPVRSRPFEEHDFSWLAPRVSEAGAKAEARGGDARGWICGWKASRASVACG